MTKQSWKREEAPSAETDELRPEDAERRAREVAQRMLT